MAVSLVRTLILSDIHGNLEAFGTSQSEIKFMQAFLSGIEWTMTGIEVSTVIE